MRRAGDSWDELRREIARFGASTWQPLVDVVVANDRAWVRMEVAGVAARDLQILVHGNVVEVRGVRRPPEHAANRGFMRAEIWYGSFERRIELPWRARPVEEGAAVRRGVLDLLLERVESGGNVRVPVLIGKVEE